MKQFHIPEALPQEWFQKNNDGWFATTHLGNTVGTNFLDRLHYVRDKHNNRPTFRKADIFLVSPQNDTFIPVSSYDEHEDGRPLLREVYKNFGINPAEYLVYRPYGLNIPLTKEDNDKLYGLFKKLKEYGYDISKSMVYTGYLANNVQNPKIKAEEFLAGNYNTDVIDIPLTHLGEEIKACFEQFRDIFAKQVCGKYSTRKMKEIVGRLYFLVKEYDLIKEEEYKTFIYKIDMYKCDELSDEDLEKYLFGYNGFRNIIHNRIRSKINDQKFIELVGNPTMLNNIISAM